MEVEEHLANGAYQKVVQSLLQLTRPVDRFFDEVLVMAEDEAIRQNRLGLLAALSAVLSTLGNLKAIRAS